MLKYLAVFLVLICSISKAEDKQIAKSGGPVFHLIFWHENGCQPCKNAERDLTKDPRYLVYNPEEVNGSELRTNDEQLFFKTEKVSSWPTFVLYRELNIGGKIYLREVSRRSGYTDKISFFNWLQRNK